MDRVPYVIAAYQGNAFKPIVTKEPVLLSEEDQEAKLRVTEFLLQKRRCLTLLKSSKYVLIESGGLWTP